MHKWINIVKKVQINLCLLFVGLVYVVFPMQLCGQVIIKEDIKVGTSVEFGTYINTKTAGAKMQSRLEYFWSWYQGPMIVQKDGELKITLAQAKSYLHAIDVDTMASFGIEIWGKQGRRDTVVKIKDIFRDPLVGTMHLRSEKEWYLYGRGPFAYVVDSLDPELVKDAVVKILHKRSIEIIGYDEDNEPIIKYTYKGKTQHDKNFGNYPSIAAVSFDWGKARMEEPERYYEKYRGFMELDVSGFTFPVEYIDSSLLEIFAYDLDTDVYEFLLEEVSAPWGEFTITWENQPPAGGKRFVLKNPEGNIGYYPIAMKELVLKWIEDPSSNYGLRFKLRDEESLPKNADWVGIGIPGSDYSEPTPYTPTLTINFSNPNYRPGEFVLSTGSVQVGDTLLISYRNGKGEHLLLTDWRRGSYELNEEMVPGKFFDFESYGSGSTAEFGNSSELMRPFVYVGEKTSDEILLGQTKYYAAVRNPDSGEITIKEVETDANETPDALENLVSNAFSSDPIEVISGGKSGVYWERKSATISDEGAISTKDLPSGMIRVVGRYWEKEKDYKVKLKASGGAELEIKVVKPDKLGDKYGKARDVFDNEVDVDSVIIKYAGKYGIPPQWIKGQMRQETPPKEFILPGGNKEGFPPAYRYEPFTTEFDIRTTKDPDGSNWSESSFWVTETSMGMDSPPNHLHIRYKPYPKSSMTVWDMVNKYSHLVNKSNFSMYGKLLDSGRMDFEKYGYKTVQGIYDNILDYLSSSSKCNMK